MMALGEDGKSQEWPWGFNSDACLRMVLRIFARDYGIILDDGGKSDGDQS